MKKFVLLYCGIERSEESRSAWAAWFAENAAVFIDGGNPLAGGRWVTSGGARDLPGGSEAIDATPIDAYSIVSVDDSAAAERLAASCPAVDGVRLYEALPM
jgi:hypothetical protein